MKKKCLKCNKIFHVHAKGYNRRKYCSVKCYRDNTKGKNKKCLRCGKTFYVPPCFIRNVYCSFKCRRTKCPAKKCLTCGRFFGRGVKGPKEWQAKKYCSLKCKYNSKYPIRQCLRCERRFRCGSTKRYFCSAFCNYAGPLKQTKDISPWQLRRLELKELREQRRELQKLRRTIRKISENSA